MDRPTVHLGDALANRQTEAMTPLRFDSAAIVESHEPFKNPRQLLLRQPGSFVGDNKGPIAASGK